MRSLLLYIILPLTLVLLVIGFVLWNYTNFSIGQNTPVSITSTHPKISSIKIVNKRLWEEVLRESGVLSINSLNTGGGKTVTIPGKISSLEIVLTGENQPGYQYLSENGREFASARAEYEKNTLKVYVYIEDSYLDDTKMSSIIRTLLVDLAVSQNVRRTGSTTELTPNGGKLIEVKLK